MAKLKIKKIKVGSILYHLDNSFIVKLLVPKGDSYKRVKSNLKRLGMDKVERVYSYQVITMVLCFFILIIGNLYYIDNTKNQLIYGQVTNKPSSLISSSTSSNSSNENVQKEIVRKTILLVPNYNDYINKNNLQPLVPIIKNAIANLNISDNDNTYAKSTIETLVLINDLKLKPLIILIFILISLASSKLVDSYYNIKNIFRVGLIEKEIQRLELLTIILTGNTNITVKDLLFKLASYSTYLSPYFYKCLNIYDSNSIKALDELIDEVNTPDFSDFIFLIQQNLLGDKATNLALLQSQNNSYFALSEQSYIKRVDKFGMWFGLLSYPLWILSLFLLFYAFINFINLNSF